MSLNRMKNPPIMGHIQPCKLDTLSQGLALLYTETIPNASPYLYLGTVRRPTVRDCLESPPSISFVLPSAHGTDRPTKGRITWMSDVKTCGAPEMQETHRTPSMRNLCLSSFFLPASRPPVLTWPHKFPRMYVMYIRNSTVLMLVQHS